MTALCRYEIVVRPAEERLSLDALAARADMHPALVRRFFECGLIEPSAREGEELFFDVAAIPRLRMIERLRGTLGINVAGIAVILDLCERVRALQRENQTYRLRL